MKKETNLRLISSLPSVVMNKNTYTLLYHLKKIQFGFMLHLYWLDSLISCCASLFSECNIYS